MRVTVEPIKQGLTDKRCTIQTKLQTSLQSKSFISSSPTTTLPLRGLFCLPPAPHSSATARPMIKKKAVGVVKIHCDKEHLKCHRAFVTSTDPPRPRVFLPGHYPPSCSLTGQQNHLHSEHRADLGEQHVTGQGEQDVRFEGGEPHHPLQISRVL